MSSAPGGRGKRTPYDPHAAAKERKAAYMRHYRARRDVRERPETRVLDRALTASLALFISIIDERDGAAVRRVIASRAIDGLLREGYDYEAAQAAILDRLEDLGDGSTSSSVHEAYTARKWGQRAAGRRVRHEDALTTPS